MRKKCSSRGRGIVHFVFIAVFVADLAGLLGGQSACSSSGKSGAADAAADGAGGAGSPSSLTCQGIRLCVTAGSDPDSCAARGTAEAQAAFQTLRGCLEPVCPGLLLACVCRESCQQPDGYCLDETDACVAASGSSVDAVCGQYCGG